MSGHYKIQLTKESEDPNLEEIGKMESKVWLWVGLETTWFWILYWLEEETIINIIKQYPIKKSTLPIKWH